MDKSKLRTVFTIFVPIVVLFIIVVLNWRSYSKIDNRNTFELIDILTDNNIYLSKLISFDNKNLTIKLDLYFFPNKDCNTQIDKCNESDLEYLSTKTIVIDDYTVFKINIKSLYSCVKGDKEMQLVSLNYTKFFSNDCDYVNSDQFFLIDYFYPYMYIFQEFNF